MIVGPSAPWDWVRCPICGLEFLRPGLIVHLCAEHGYTPEEARRAVEAL